VYTNTIYTNYIYGFLEKHGVFKTSSIENGLGVIGERTTNNATGGGSPLSIAIIPPYIWINN
jgi:hypothetical protein